MLSLRLIIYDIFRAINAYFDADIAVLRAMLNAGHACCR